MGRRKVPVPPAVERTLDAALDTTLAVQRPVVLTYLDRVRHAKPHATPAEVITGLERRYLAAVAGIGAASGGLAALPGSGTAASLAAGTAEIGAFVSATGMYTLALAELYAVPCSDPEVRRAMVLAVLVGSAGDEALADVRRGAPHWASVLKRPDTKNRIASVNSRLASLMMTRFGARQGALLVGRALPLGVGAGIGAAGNAALAHAAISTARRGFGPPPAQFPPAVIES